MKKLFRKIHLWLSVPFGVFITLICFSGSMLVFEKEIAELLRPGLYSVEKTEGKPLPLDVLMERVAATLPDSVSVTGLTVSPEPERTWQASLSKPRRASLYVDPYTGEVKGRSERLPFFDTMFHLHRWLMGSAKSADGRMSPGKWIVGTSTLMLVLILVTGILMWLTNKHKPLKKSLTISFTKGWPRFWHDLHVAGGIYATLFLLAVALTGLTWSFAWYRTGFYSLFGVEASAGEGQPRESGKPQVSGGREGRGRNGSPETGERHERGQRGEGRGRGGHRSPYAHWQEVYEELAAAYPGYRQITLSDGSASVVPEDRRSLRAGDRFGFDRRSGEVTWSVPYAEQDKASRLRGNVYMVHVGGWGGMLTRILTFLSALLGATLPLTGYYLWIRRLIGKGKHHRHRADAPMA